ncbi:hypothetical protein BH24DEI2_BH24DEI2_02060 [soil metagenome]
MIYDYVVAGSVCLAALLVSGTLLGLPLYRRHVTLNWLETPVSEMSRDAGEPQI